MDKIESKTKFHVNVRNRIICYTRRVNRIVRVNTSIVNRSQISHK